MPNSIIEQQWTVYEQTRSLRDELFEVLSAADLATKLPGANPTLGALCREMGEVQQSYIDSFKIFKQDFSYKHADQAVETDLEKLKAWFVDLDAAMKAALESLSEDDIQNKMIERGFQLPVTPQLHVYREGLLIFYAKVAVYLKAMEKPLPGRWPHWIG